MPRLKRILAALVLFGVSFGYVEAAVVVYLRAIYDPMRQELSPGLAPGELFPLIPLEELERAGPQHTHRLATELVREAATLLMLSAVALAVASNFVQWFGAFVIAFGVWDIFFYLFLKVLLDWPASLLTWDLLFLIPVPWVAPVLAPVLVSLTMIAAGVVVLWYECQGRSVQPLWFHWVSIVAGGLILIAAFAWDFRNTSAGGQPNPFNWPLFVCGQVVGLSGFLHALRRRAGGRA